jgi:cytochrome c biogenesis factor
VKGNNFLYRGNDSLYASKRRVSKKEIVFGTIVLCIPLILFLTAILIPSWSSDVDIRVLLPNMIFFLFLSFCAAVMMIGFLVDIIVNKINKTNKYKKKEFVILIIVLFTLIMLTYGAYSRAEDALKDFEAKDLYITAVIERIAPGIDGSRPTVKFKYDENIYDLWQLDSVLQLNKEYTFKYYKNNNLLYLIDDTVH